MWTGRRWYTGALYPNLMLNLAASQIWPLKWIFFAKFIILSCEVIFIPKIWMPAENKLTANQAQPENQAGPVRGPDRDQKNVNFFSKNQTYPISCSARERAAWFINICPRKGVSLSPVKTSSETNFCRWSIMSFTTLLLLLRCCQIRALWCKGQNPL